MTYSIRLFCEADAPRLAALTHAAITAIGPHSYSPAQVAAWANRHQTAERFVTRAANGVQVWVAIDATNDPAGYALLEVDEHSHGHLDMLYCHPDHTRRGLANRLLASAESNACKAGIARLYTEASELARPAFERAGYVVMHRRDFDIGSAGQPIPIHNYAMEKLLDRAAPA